VCIDLGRGFIKPACRVNPTDNGAMDANLDPVVAALSEAGDAELHA
jgi:hypothetical protein